MNQASFHCPRCQQIKLFQSQPMNHTPHLLAAIFLCGLYLPVWILTAISYTPAWHCSVCGYSDRVDYLANPERKAYDAMMAAQQAEERVAALRQQTADRKDATAFQRFGFFVKDNSLPLTIFAFVVIGFGAVLAFSIVSEMNNHRGGASTIVSNNIRTPTPTPSPSPTPKKRR